MERKNLSCNEKDLLIKDLCARLPYGVMVHTCSSDLHEMSFDIRLHHTMVFQDFNKYNPRPYLRSIASMTNEEKAELKTITNEFEDNWLEATTPEERWKYTFLNSSNEIDWLNTHHFDYRGLIEKGLALEAPENMYNLKE